VGTYLTVRGSMVSSVDQQLRSTSATYAICIETNHQAPTGAQGAPGQPGGDSDDHPPPPNSSSCSQGQPQGMLGVRIKDGEITNCGVVNGMNNETCHLSTADPKAIMALHVYQRSAYQQPPGEVNPARTSPRSTGITG
jgi:hypothetical protein